MADLTCPTLIDLLPDVNRRIDSTGDLSAFVEDVLQPVLQLLCDEANRWVDQADIDLADSNSVDAFLRDLGNPFEVAFGQDLSRRRLLARNLINIYLEKGTEQGIVDAIRALTGIEVVTIVAPASTLGGWDLGVHVLGDTAADPPPVDPNLTDIATLGFSAGFVLYSFEVEVDRTLTQDEKDVLTEIIQLMKPAHTHFLGFVEPTTTVTVDHWELSLSHLHDAGEPLQGDEIDLHE